MSAKNKRLSFRLEGESEQIDSAIELFETGALSELLGVEVLDLGAMHEPAYSFTSNLEAKLSHRESPLTNPLQQFQNLLDNLSKQGYRPAYRSNTANLAKAITVGQQKLDLFVQIDQLNSLEIQLFLQVRSAQSQGYLPIGLEVVLLDESDTVIVRKIVHSHTGVLDLTQGHRLLCDYSDRLTISFALGNASVREYFPQ
jgi:Protein of unknown function (DUF1822)